MCPQTGMMCLRRYILVWQVEVLASCLVEALIIAAAKSNHQGQQSPERVGGRHSALANRGCCWAGRGGRQRSERSEEPNVEVTR